MPSIRTELGVEMPAHVESAKGACAKTTYLGGVVRCAHYQVLRCALDPEWGSSNIMTLGLRWH